MSTPQLTEERLRTWLNSQPDRERMCLGILALDKRFSDVRPRRPKGGPDGARDITACYSSNGEVVWGAVGFRNNAQDTPEDKRLCREKFQSDLDAALNENPSLWGFVFFTNIDLTPAEQTELEKYAKHRGISFIDIFNRERLRIVLDSPKGLAFRVQYLDIPMSNTEQAAFFAEYGSKLETTILEKFDAVDEKLERLETLIARLEFLQDRVKPLTRVSLVLRLNQMYKPGQLGHFRFVAQILDLSQRDPHPGLWIAGRDACQALEGSANNTMVVGIKNLIWSQNPDIEVRSTIVVGAHGLGGALYANYDSYHAWDSADFITRDLKTGLQVGLLGAGGWIKGLGPFKSLGDLDGRNLTIYFTKPLFEQVSEVILVADRYEIAKTPIKNLVPLDQKPHFTWPEPLSDEEQKIPWVVVLVKTAEPDSVEPGAPYWTNWSLEFMDVIPRKVN